MRFQLDNGLTWIYSPQRTSPVVAIQVWVKTGSADEQPEEYGLAHLHEHMLFKGTARRGPGEIARDVEAHGGEINAWTSFDQTVYHLVMASRFFADGVDILADAVRSSTFDSGELTREIEVVVEEIKRSYDAPSRKLSKALFALAFGKHPYARPVIGSEDSVRSMNREKMLAFFHKHYRPDNACVVITGDVELEAARVEVERAFGGRWGSPPVVLPPRPAESWPAGIRAEVVHDDVKEAHLSICFPAPRIDAVDLPALDTLAVILGQGESSRLELGVKRKMLANDARAYAYTPRDPGLFSLDATLEAATLGPCVTALLAEALRLRDEPCDAAELDAAKAMLEAEAVYQKETVQGMARRLGFYETVAGGLDQEELYHRRIAGLTAADIQAVARRYLDLGHCAAVALVPQGDPFSGAQLKELIERAQPVAGPPRPPRPPEIPYVPSPIATPSAAAQAPVLIRHVLANGVTVLVRRERGIPLVALRAALPGGLLHESDADNGLHQLLARTLTQGTKQRGAEAIAHLTDAMAGSLSGNAGRNSVGLRGEFLTRHLERGFDLFAECLLEPAFSEGEVERERSIQLQQIKSREDHPSGVAFQLFNRALYGEHPYHRDPAGEVASVTGLTGASLTRAWGERLAAGNVVIGVVGECDPDRVLTLVEKRLGSALPRAVSKGRAGSAVARLASPRLVRQESKKAQAHLVYGFLGLTMDDADRPALEVLSSVLSGQGGRLFIELRDKRSMAYSVSSFSMEGIDPGYFAVYMGTSPEKVTAAAAGIRTELEKIRSERISAQELARAHSYLIGSHAIALQKNASRATIMTLDELYGLGAENYRQYEERILAVDVEKVRAVAQRILRFDAACVALLGPADAAIPL